MGQYRKTDYRAILARRQTALARKELVHEKRRPSSEELRLVEEAVRAGGVTRCPPRQRRRR